MNGAKTNILTFKSLFVLLTGIMLIFMFMNNDTYFNINKYKDILMVVDIIGVFQLLAQYKTLFKRRNLFAIIFPLLSIFFMLISKYIFGLPSVPFYIFYISLLYIFLLCMGLIDFSKKQLRFLLMSYILSATIMSLFIIVQHRTPYQEYGIFRFALYYGPSEYYDVNFTAMYLIMPTLISFKMATKSRKQMQRIIFLICTIINVVSVLLLGSRGAFAPILAIVLFEVLKESKVSIDKILIIVIVAVALFFFLPDDVFIRLLGTNYINPESKRIVDWTYGMNAFQQAPWFGNGLRSPKEIVTTLMGDNWHTIHNTYIVYLAQLGILGSIPFFAILIYPLNKLWNGIRHSFLFMVYCSILFAAMMIESNYTYVLIVPLSFSYALVHYVNLHAEYSALDSVLNLKE